MTDTKQHWERVYQDNSPLKVSWFQLEPALSLRLISGTGIALDAPIIDVGGGASLLVDRLHDAGYSDIAVLDVSASALTHARGRLKGKAGDIDWYEADVTTFEPPKQFSLWHDRAVFHFLTTQVEQRKYVNVLKKSLAPGGHLIIQTFAIDGPAKCSGLDIVQYDENKMKETLGQGFRLTDAGHETHITPSGGQQKFAWFHFIRNPG